MTSSGSTGHCQRQIWMLDIPGLAICFSHTPPPPPVRATGTENWKNHLWERERAENHDTASLE